MYAVRTTVGCVSRILLKSFKILYEHHFVMQLHKLEGRCGYCIAFDIDTPVWHDISRCPILESHGLAAYFIWRPHIRYESRRHGQICYFCHIPITRYMCLHPSFSSDPKECRYRDLIASTVFGILTNVEKQSMVQHAFPHANLTSPMAAVQWLNAAPIAGHRTNLTAIFLWYMDQHVHL